MAVLQGLDKTTGSDLLKFLKSEVWKMAPGKLTWECGQGRCSAAVLGLNVLKPIGLALERLPTVCTAATAKACIASIAKLGWDDSNRKKTHKMAHCK